MAKKPTRFVKADMGYGSAECWERVRVIDSRMIKDLFDEGKENESLLVERAGGTRLWITRWTKYES